MLHYDFKYKHAVNQIHNKVMKESQKTRFVFKLGVHWIPNSTSCNSSVEFEWSMHNQGSLHSQQRALSHSTWPTANTFAHYIQILSFCSRLTFLWTVQSIECPQTQGWKLHFHKKYQSARHSRNKPVFNLKCPTHCLPRQPLATGLKGDNDSETIQKPSKEFSFAS